MACFGHHPPHQWTQRLRDVSQIEFDPMRSLREARLQLYHHVCRGLALVHLTGALIGGNKEAIMKKLKAQQAVGIRRLRRWHSDFHGLLKEIGSSLHGTERYAASVLLMYFHTTEIWNLTCLDPSPMVYDEHRHRFELVLRHAEEALHAGQLSHTSKPPPFSFEMGVIPPLYLTGWRCHHPLLRRQALALIRRAPAQEALFSADLNYRAIAKMIELEEGPDHLPTDLAQFEACVKAGAEIVLPKEEDRVNGATLHFENSHGEKEPPSLIYTKGRSPELFAWEQKTTVVPI